MRAVLLPLFAVLAVLLIDSGSVDPILAWGLAAVVGYASLRHILRAMFPPHLLLTSEGFRHQGLSTRSVGRWTDVDRFWELKIPTKVPVILYGGAEPRRTGFGLWVFRALPSEADGYIPVGLTLAHADVLALLNEWKARYGG